MNHPSVSMLQLREALEASWDERTSYLAVLQKGNPALGQCYPTSRVVQFFFSQTEIAKGKVWNGKGLETHFWNVLTVGEQQYHIDLSWQQFPAGSNVRNFELLNRDKLGDSEPTIERCELLKQRVLDYLDKKSNKS